MHRGISVTFRIARLLIAVLILIAVILVGLLILPNFAAVLTSFGYKPPVVTQAVLTFGPGVLIAVGVMTATSMWGVNMRRHFVWCTHR